MKKLAIVLAMLMMLALSASPALADSNHYGCQHHCGDNLPAPPPTTNDQSQSQYQFVVVVKKGHKGHKHHRGGHKHHK